MATLDDKLLGEKLHYYCSSSEESGDEGEADNEDDTSRGKDGGKSSAKFVPEGKVAEYEEGRKWQGNASNTGPKGVIEDWRRFKQLESEKRESEDAERLALMHKLSLTCKTEAEEARERAAAAEEQRSLDELLERELLEGEDAFLQEYRHRRMQEMAQTAHDLPKFGRVLELASSQEFLTAVDKEHKQTIVVVHVYEDNAACAAMNGCLQCLAGEYITVKFCQLKASNANLSKKFLKKGVPALVSYRGGELIGSFVQLSSVFGDDFFATDVESYLVEHGVLPDKSCVPSIIRGPQLRESDDSDFDLD